MSLDVYLELAGAPPSVSESGIFIREDGATREISRTEWDQRFPGREPVTLVPAAVDGEPTTIYSANITHNLGPMAKAAGVYEPLWRPDEIGLTKASQLVAPLRAGRDVLRSDPAKFAAFNPENGWGDYDGLVRFVENYLAACEEYPDADVRVSR